jgi:hypothetical protein
MMSKTFRLATNAREVLPRSKRGIEVDLLDLESTHLPECGRTIHPYEKKQGGVSTANAALPLALGSHAIPITALGTRQRLGMAEDFTPKWVAAHGVDDHLPGELVSGSQHA